MRSLGFDAPGELRTDGYSVIVDIYIEKPGEDDPDGNPQPPQRTYYVEDAPADLQPRSGSQRAAQSGTVHESTHVLFLWGPVAEAPVGAMVDVKSEVGGSVSRSFTVVFTARWGTHVEIDLKAVTA